MIGRIIHEQVLYQCIQKNVDDQGEQRVDTLGIPCADHVRRSGWKLIATERRIGVTD